jgi:hypothetical protein
MENDELGAEDVGHGGGPPEFLYTVFRKIDGSENFFGFPLFVLLYIKGVTLSLLKEKAINVPRGRKFKLAQLSVLYG